MCVSCKARRAHDIIHVGQGVFFGGSKSKTLLELHHVIGVEMYTFGTFLVHF